MRVLGLDPGSRRTGYGVVEKRGNALACLAHGHIAPPPAHALPQRIHFIVERVAEIMDRCTPQWVVIEEAFHHRSVRSTLVLGHVRGALLVAALQRGLEVAEYSPRAIKLSVTGAGGAAKEQVAFMVRRLLALADTPQPDAADALAGALCHLHRTPAAGAIHAVPGARGPSPAARRLEALLATRSAR